MKSTRLAIFIASMLVSTSAFAQTAITFTGGVPTTEFPGRTLGYSFTVNSTISIGQLGFWDQDGDGLTDAHAVGIWDATGATLLASTIIPSGTASPLIDGFRFSNIATLTLGPGEYLAGAYTASDADAVPRFTTASTIPQITLGSTRYDVVFNAPGLAAPIGTQGTDYDSGYFGANFRLVTGGVPEPSTWAMMLGGFGALGYAMRRRQKVAFSMS